MVNFLESGRIEIEYMNVFPPVANHYSRNASDFENRLKKLSTEDVQYLTDKIIDGPEGVSHLDPEYAEVFLQLLEERYQKERRIV